MTSAALWSYFKELLFIFRVCRALRSAPNAFSQKGLLREMPFAVATPPVRRQFWKIRVCAAMKAPVGLLSGRAVCASRWKGFALTSSAERSKRISTGGVVKANGICSAASCESAALGLASSPSPSLLCKSTSPKGRGLGIAVKFPVYPQSLRFRQRLSLWESWQAR